jgi:hypothetical protein
MITWLYRTVFYQMLLLNLVTLIIGQLHQNNEKEIRNTKQKVMRTIGGFGTMHVILSRLKIMFHDVGANLNFSLSHMLKQSIISIIQLLST